MLTSEMYLLTYDLYDGELWIRNLKEIFHSRKQAESMKITINNTIGYANAKIKNI